MRMQLNKSNLSLFFYALILVSKQVNELTSMNDKLNHDEISAEVISNKKLKNICSHDIEQLDASCLVTFIPCGDTKDWNKLKNPFVLAKNNSLFTLDYDNHMKLLDYTRQITKRLNDVNRYMKSTDIINLVQEKKLGKNGYSIYYLKYVRNLDIDMNAYVSYKHKYHQNKYYWNHPTDYNLNSCDYYEVSYYDPGSRKLVRKQISKDKYADFKRKHWRQIEDMKISLNSTRVFRVRSPQSKPSTSYEALAKKRDKIEFSSYRAEHPLLNKLYVNSVDNLTDLGSLNRTVDVSKPNKTKPAVTKISRLNTNDEIKFFYNFDTDKINELNILFKKFTSYEDSILCYAIIQDKFTHEIYMHIKSKAGKYYLNVLSSLNQFENKFFFKFKKTNMLTIRMRSVELWNIIRYEVFIPYPICNVVGENAEQSLPASAYLNCDRFDEKDFYLELYQREQNRKYKEIHVSLSNELRAKFDFDHYKCILLEYFGKIFTCSGKVLSVEEFGYMRSKNLGFLGLIILNHGKPALLRVDNYGNMEEFRDSIKIRPSHVSNPNQTPQLCHECAKTDLRAKVESNQAYNQYKQAIKVQGESIEKYAIMFLIFIVLSMFWFKNNSKKHKNIR